MSGWTVIPVRGWFVPAPERWLFSGRRHVSLLRASPRTRQPAQVSAPSASSKNSRRLRTKGHSQHPVPAARREKTWSSHDRDRPSDLSFHLNGPGRLVEGALQTVCSMKITAIRQGASQRPITPTGGTPCSRVASTTSYHPQNQSSIDQNSITTTSLSTQLDQPPVASLLLATETKRVF